VKATTRKASKIQHHSWLAESAHLKLSSSVSDSIRLGLYCRPPLPNLTAVEGMAAHCLQVLADIIGVLAVETNPLH
jgi:hypothetical protein